MQNRILSFALALALLVQPVAFGNELRGEIDQEAKPIYLLKSGHLPRKHWYSIKPGAPFWIYRLPDGGEKLTYEPLAGVPDTRDDSDRNPWLRRTTNFLQWSLPLMAAGGVTLLGIKR